MADVASARERVQATLQQILGTVAQQDDVGNWMLPAGSAQVMVNVAQAAPEMPALVVVASPMLGQVQLSPDLLATVNQLNAQLSFARVYWVNGFVIASIELLAETLDVPELAAAISQIAQVADTYDDDLRARFGGVLPFVQGAPPAGPIGPWSGPVSDATLPPPPPGAVSPLVGALAPGGAAGPPPPPPPPPPPGQVPTVTGV